ncbi:RNA polymerase sigma-70 factor [Pedobacter sp. ASV1-7]|uniref:RNA polymerase sigma factor n=1 Tax=Pedobacter sp. ASV1-7 TaxID=3145237 RepID=UPI0032E8EC51
MISSGESQDNLLLQQLALGDELAFTSVYDQYWEPLLRHIMRILPDKDEAIDVVQETFLSFWNQGHKLERVNSIKTYLFTMGRNAAFKKWKLNLKQRNYLENLVAHYAEADEGFEQIINTKELSAVLDAEIEKLPAKMREIFILSRKEHLTYKEIAEKLQISDLTVKKQINNSLKQLRLKIGEEYIPYLVLLYIMNN